MVSISDLKMIFDGVSEFVKNRRNNNRIMDEDYENALFAIYTATSETKNYVSTLNRRKKADKEKEKHLSYLWNSAGIRLRKIDQDLAYRCVIKADYWAAPDEWTQADIQESKIALNEIIQESRNLIKNV